MSKWLQLLSCRHSLAFWERAGDESPPSRTPLACRLHFGICRHCRRYRRQVGLLRRALRQLEVRSELNSEQRLPDDFKSGLRQRLQKELPSAD